MCWPPLFFEHLNLLLTITGRWSDISEDIILTLWRYYGWLPQMWSRPVFQRLCISSGQALYYPAPFAMLFFFRYCNKVVHNEQLVWQRLTIRNNQSLPPLFASISPIAHQSFCTHGSFVPRRFVPRLRHFVPTFDQFVPNPLVDLYPTNYETKCLK